MARVTRQAVREAFTKVGRTKYEIAKAISDWFPELAARLPVQRRLWLAEDQRMNICDAMAFFLTVRSRGRPHNLSGARTTGHWRQ